jgi:L-threonylcarbamoyladenylate synthase
MGYLEISPDMIKTFTNEPFLMVNHYECDVAVKALLAEKTILFPTDTVWSIGCLPLAVDALQQISTLKREIRAENFEVLFDSIAQLKLYCPFLHPKLETLLSFHKRPLTLLVDQIEGLPTEVYDFYGQVNVRVVQDDLGRQLIGEVDQPIITMPAGNDEQDYPRNFGAIPSDFLQGVDYIMKIRQRDVREQDELSVKVRIDKQENLIFLRD